MKNNFDDTIELNYFEGNTKKDILKNEELKNLIQFKLDKTFFEENDLIQIEDITLDGRKINGDINIVHFNELDYFPNLKKIELKNLDISEQYTQKLEDIEEIAFKNCKVESLEKIKNIKKISINNSTILNPNQIEKLENLIELEIINVKMEDFEFIRNLKNLQVLKIKNVRGFLLNKIKFSLPIKYLSLEGISEINEDYLIRICPNLQSLSVDREKQIEFSESLEKLMQRGVKILLNDIYEY